jgi:dipeptidyl aminopeptidase/acylaminoacyl peptidase
MKKRHLRTAVVHLVVLTVGYQLALASEPTDVLPLAVRDALGIRLLGENSPVTFSADGKWIAFMVLDNQRAKSEKLDTTVRTGIVSRSEGDIWIANTDTGQVANLTAGEGSNWKPTWSPNGRYLAFLSDQDGSGQAKLWVWDATNRKARLASMLPVRAKYSTDQILWTGDSRNILITVATQDRPDDEHVDKLIERPTNRPAETAPIPDSTVTLYNATAGHSEATRNAPMFDLDEFNLRDLAMIDVITGQFRILIQGRRIEEYSLSPDGLHVLWAMPKRFYKPGWYRRVFDLMVLNLATMQTDVLASDILLNVEVWSPDGSLVAYSTHGEDEKSFELHVVSVSAKSGRKLAVLPYDAHEGLVLIPIWETGGKNLYFILNGSLWKTSVSAGTTFRLCEIPGFSLEYVISQRDGELWIPAEGHSTIVVAHDDGQKQDAIFRVDVTTGASTKLREDGHCYTCGWPPAGKGSPLTTASSDGRHVAYVAEDAQHMPDIWVTDSSFTDPRQLTHLNPQLDQYQMGEAKRIGWLGDDGEVLHGALLLPANYQPGRKYPLLVWVYPGVALSNDCNEFGFSHDLGPLNMQLFATRGYAVLFPDAIDKVGDRMQSLAKSVLPGVSKAIELGIADPDRVGVMGHSQGGFAVLELLVQTNRFKVAMAADGWGDSTSYYGVMYPDGTGYQYGQAERQLGGAPWNNPLTYVQNSPLYYLDRVQTPVLLVHGTADGDLPPFLSDEVFVALRRLGKPVEYAKYEGEPHVPIDWNYANQLDLAVRTIQWFDHYLGTSVTKKSESQ